MGTQKMLVSAYFCFLKQALFRKREAITQLQSQLSNKVEQHKTILQYYLCIEET